MLDAYSWTALHNEDPLAPLNGLYQGTSFGAAIAGCARGNLTADGTSTFGYDAQNRLTSAAAAGVTASLKYDPLGRLYETAVSGAPTARFLYGRAEAIAEYDAAGLKTRFVRGGQAGRGSRPA